MLEKNELNKSLNNKPIIAVGIVPSINKYPNLKSLLLVCHFNQALQIDSKSFQYTVSNTNNVEKCNNISNEIGTSRPNNCWKSAKWPELEIGSHSVNPCIIPSIIACQISITHKKQGFKL
jgi:hypothetical protein